MKKLIAILLAPFLMNGQETSKSEIINPEGKWFFSAEIGTNTITSYTLGEPNKSFQAGILAEFYTGRHWSLTGKVKYFETDEQGDFYTEGVTFNELAAGFKTIIAMIGDMVYRLSQWQGDKKLRNLEGIVIIDEIELHLHPKYQKIFIEKLTELFPKIQFIASTHSPVPLLGSPKEMIVINVNRTEEEGIVAKILDINFQNLTPEDILSSPVFGFDDFIPASNENLEAISTEQNPTEAKQILGLKQKLKLLKANLNVN